MVSPGITQANRSGLQFAPHHSRLFNRSAGQKFEKASQGAMLRAHEYSQRGINGTAFLPLLSAGHATHVLVLLLK
jgi:hypothetical protein